MVKKKKAPKKPVKKVVTKPITKKKKIIPPPAKKRTKAKVNPVKPKKPVKKVVTKKKVITPAKKLESVKKDLVKARQPIYSLNRKIKNAKNRNQERKFKKEKKLLLAEVEPKIEKLKKKKKRVLKEVAEFDKVKVRKKQKQAKIRRLEKRIEKATDDRDYDLAKKLGNELIRELGDSDKISDELGTPEERQSKENFDREDYEEDGGKGFELDTRSPYAVFEATRQLDEDTFGGNYKFIIINGKRLSTQSVINISLEGSSFFLTAKEQVHGTPYFNRYVNNNTFTVKYTHIFL